MEVEEPKTDRNQRVAVAAQLALAAESQMDRSVRALWEREEPANRKDWVPRQALRGFLRRSAVWVRVPVPQVVQEAYQIYLPAEYLAEEEVVLEAVDW